MLSVTSQQLDLWIGQALWPFCRILALFSAAPILYHRSVPLPVKVGLSMAIAFLVAPSLETAVPLTSAHAPAVLAQQLMIGLALGFSTRLIFAAVELAGDLIGLQMGLSFAAYLDPMHNTQTPLVGALLGVLASLLFLAINGHLLMINAVVESFQSFPIGKDVALPIDGARLASWTGQLFRIGLHLSLPVLTTMLILNLALGVLVRSAPQLNLFSIGFPVTLLVGLLVMALSLPYLVPYLLSALEDGVRL